MRMRVSVFTFMFAALLIPVLPSNAPAAGVGAGIKVPDKQEQPPQGEAISSAPAAGKTAEAASGDETDVDDAAIIYIKADTLTEQDLTAKAMDEYEGIIKNYPGTWWAELSYVKLAGLDMKDGKSAEAVELLSEFSAKYPESILKEKAQYSICLAYVLSGDKKKAKKSIKEFIKNYPDSPKVEDAKKLLKEL